MPLAIAFFNVFVHDYTVYVYLSVAGAVHKFLLYCCLYDYFCNTRTCVAHQCPINTIVPHGGVLVRGEKAVAGLHASNSHCPLSWLAGHKHWLLVRLLWHRNLLEKKQLMEIKPIKP